jgi:hypothetical protein
MDRNEWFLKVRSTIGGSSAAASIGKGRFKTPMKLWEQMVEARDGVIRYEQASPDMERGTRMEPIARDVLSEKLGEAVRPHPQDEFIANQDYPWAHCLPDGLLADGALVELKVPRPATCAKVRMRGLFDEWRIQAEHNAVVAKAPYTMIGILDPITMGMDALKIVPDPVFVEMLMRGEREFFESVLSRTPPMIDTLPETPVEHDPGVVILDSEEAIRAAENFVRLYSLVADAEEVMVEAKTRLATISGCWLSDGKLVGGPEAFEVPGLVRVYHKATAGRRTFDKDKVIAAHPQLAGDEWFKVGAPSRSFRPYLLQKGE